MNVPVIDLLYFRGSHDTLWMYVPLDTLLVMFQMKVLIILLVLLHTLCAMKRE